MRLFSRLMIIAVLFSVIACEPEFERNQRVLVKGVVMDSEGQGLENYDVRIYTRASTGFFIFFHSEDDYLLGSGTTASDGSFNITSLSDRDRDFSIFVDGQEVHTDYLYAAETQDYFPPNSTFDLGNVTLKSKAAVDFSIIRNSPAGTTISYSLSYQTPTCAEVYEQGELNPDLSECYLDYTIWDNLSDSNPDETHEFETTLGSVITLSYSINEEPTVIETFTVDQLINTYEFTY